MVSRGIGTGFGTAAAALLLLATCAERPTGPTTSGDEPVRVLMVTATAGFRHDSISAAREVMDELARSTGEFTVSPTEDLSRISTPGLADLDVVFFALTSGELALDNARKTALLEFVTAGGGFMGAHSATDTLHGWPEYGALVGAYFKEHPWTTTATVRVEDEQHEGTTGLGDRFSILEEFYTFQANPRPSVHVLLSLDPASVGAAGDFPLAWTRQHGQGRVYYNALGHFPDTWRDPRFRQQLTGAIRWAAGGLSRRLVGSPVTHLLTPPVMPAPDPRGWPPARGSTRP